VVLVSVDLDGLLDGARRGRARDVARLISLVEDDAPQAAALLRQCAGHVGHARVVGITGPPGAGKSTTTTAMVARLRDAGRRVAVLAVDPSSPYSGGALLGDRIRMQELATDPRVYIRSMAARGHLGGLAATTSQVIRVLDAVGFDDVLIETVGVGQSEIEIAGVSDTTVVLLAPGMGDGIQAAKAGILEIADILVVNKADREGADQTVRDLRAMLALGARTDAAWVPPVVSTVAVEGAGIVDVLAAVDQHGTWLADSGEGERRLLRRTSDEITAMALSLARSRMASASLEALVQKVLAGELDPHEAASRLLDEV
jgi:LAO/AO transport system kinase